LLDTHDTVKAASAARPIPVPKRRRWPRILVYLLIVLVVLTGAAIGGTSWYFSSQALQLAPDQPTYSLRVLALRGNTIEVTRTDDTMRPGTYSLQWTGGGRVALGAIVSSNQQGVVRRISGTRQGLRVGSHVHFDFFLYGSPAALHLSYRSVNVPDPLGPMPAWYVPGRSHTWVVLVHGRGMSVTEGMRPLSTLASLGLPVLDLSYRNDVGAPASSDHEYHLGATEWQDVQAGVRYALAHGARRIVLYGYSMGGSLVESFLHHSPQAGRVRAVVLDAPALNWSAVFDFRANQKSVPGPITALAKQVVAWRLGLGSLDDVNHIRPGADFKVRTLLFQGTGDTSVPFAANAALARARPNLVTYVEVAGAEHTQAWNANPAAYTARLKAFLSRIVH
jgi:pimeloyl-ACP methyl ester carboxylesterase